MTSVRPVVLSLMCLAPVISLKAGAALFGKKESVEEQRAEVQQMRYARGR